MSSGKLSIINGVFNEKILLCGLCVIIRRICRIKYFKELVILIWDVDDKRDLIKMKLLNINEMVEELKLFVWINDLKIGYIDVCMLVFF